MQMSNKNNLLLLVIALLMAVSLPPLLAVAQSEPRQPAPATDQPQLEPQEAETDRPEVPQDIQQATEQPGPASGVTATPLKEFKPTDKIGADSAVSFPVDI